MLVKDLEIRFKDLQKASKLLELCSSIHEGEQKVKLIQDLYNFLGCSQRFQTTVNPCEAPFHGNPEDYLMDLEYEVDPQVAARLNLEDQVERLSFEEVHEWFSIQDQHFPPLV